MLSHGFEVQNFLVYCCKIDTFQKWKNKRKISTFEALVKMADTSRKIHLTEQNSCQPFYYKIVYCTLTMRNGCREEANSDSMIELFFCLVFHCVCYYDHTEWLASGYPDPLPDASQGHAVHVHAKQNQTM